MEKRKYNALNYAQIMERDNVLVDFMFTHKGVENCVSSREIAEYLTAQGYPQKAHTVHILITRIIKQNHVPICALNSKGYYWAASKNDINLAIADLEKKIKAFQKHADVLKSFLFE